MHDTRPIGIFDSGLGGLTVVDAVRTLLPNESILYLGDTARVPYGNKSKDSITRFGSEICQFMIERGVKLIIVACNTASAVAIDTLRRRFPDTPILGVLEAGVSACLSDDVKNITVIGTRATIASNAYHDRLIEHDKARRINSIACPLFVPLVEEGEIDSIITREVIKLYLGERNYSEKSLLLLGCTHYPLLKNTLRETLPDTVAIIDSAIACADFTKDFLLEGGITAPDSCEQGIIHYFVTDLPHGFKKQASRFLGHTVENVTHVTLKEYADLN